VRNRRLTSFIANSVFILSLFPYISPIRTPFDTQPYALIWALLVLPIFFTRRRFTMPLPLFQIGMVVAFAVAVYLLNPTGLAALRSLAGYVSIFVFALIAYKTYHFVDSRIFLFAVAVWFIVAIVETLGFHLAWLLPDVRTGGIRGVTGLAAEPAHYARMVVLFLILNDFFRAERRYSKSTYIIVVTVLIAQAVMSKAGTGILLTSLFFLMKGMSFIIFYQRKFSLHAITRVLILTIAIVSIILLFLSVEPLKSSRGGQLVSRFMEQGFDLLHKDASIRNRLGHLFLSSYSIVVGKGLGFGLGTFSEHAAGLYYSSPEWISLYAAPYSKDRIMSCVGTVIYELGIVGIVLILTIGYVLFRGIKVNQSHDIRAVLFVSGSTFVVLMILHGMRTGRRRNINDYDEER